jgi:Na+-transporting NADH:ubiquinone oxidoreductase subunit B
MKFIQNAFDSIKPNFEKGGKWEKFHPIYEGHRTIFFKPDEITGKTGTQIKDAADLKRLMFTVIIAMVPALLFGMWNVGHQHFLATGVDATLLDKVLIGSIQVIPIVIVSYMQ